MIVLKKVLVATDFSPASDVALAYGRTLAGTFGASLRVLHVSENHFLRPMAADPHAVTEAQRRMLDERLTGDDRRCLRAQTILEISDNPADAITSYAKSEGIDLIVMGTHGRTGVERLLVGSVAEHVIRAAPCPVLTVRHPEREFIVPDSSETAGSRDDDAKACVRRAEFNP